MLGLEAEQHPEWVKIKQHQRGAERPCEESSIREWCEVDSAPESWESGRTSRRGHSLNGSSRVVVERWCPWIELVDWRMYMQGSWPGLFGGSERSLAQIVERLGRRGEIIRVVRGGTVAWAVMSGGLGEVEQFGQWEEVGLVHRAVRGSHRYGFHGGSGRLLLLCQESFLSFVLFVLLLWFAGGVVVLVGLGVRFTALNKDCGGSIYRQSVTIHPPSFDDRRKSYQLHRVQNVLPVCAP